LNRTTIANSDIVSAVATTMGRAMARREELDVLGMRGPQVGQVWEQVKGRLTGRIMRVSGCPCCHLDPRACVAGDALVFLEPQDTDRWMFRSTSISFVRFTLQWRLIHG